MPERKPAKAEVVKLLTKTAARRVVTRILSALDDLGAALLEAYEGKAWVALGFGSWREFCEEELHITESSGFRRLDQARSGRAITEAMVARGLPRAGVLPVTQRQAQTLKGDLPKAAKEIAGKVAKGEPVEQAVAEAVAKRKPEPDPESTVNDFRLNTKEQVARWITRARTELTAESVNRSGQTEDVLALAKMFAKAAGGTFMPPPARRDPALAARVIGCAHPRAKEQKVTTGGGKAVLFVKCGECGVRLR